jgi:hypothetical protein
VEMNERKECEMNRGPDERRYNRESLGLYLGEVVDVEILFTAKGLGGCRVQGFNRRVA